jgi:hypothetical protein
MNSLMDILTQSMGSQELGRVSGQIGSDEKTTASAVSAALPVLIGALSRNSSRDEGAQSLFKAVSKDHDGSIFDNLGSFLDNPQAGPGDGILRHVLGSKRRAVENGVSKTTGLDLGSVAKLLTTIAPLVLGALGKAQRERNMDPRGLADYLNAENREIERREPKAAGIMGALLDTDGDGDVDMSDLTKHGFDILGKMF